jgi:hypothetical protein
VVGATLRSNQNVVFQCAFHVVWSPKYRRPVLVPPVDERLMMVLAEVIQERGAWLRALEVMPDHVHALVEVESAVRRASAGQGDERSFVVHLAVRIPASAQSDPDALDERVLRGHGRWSANGRDQAVR